MRKSVQQCITGFIKKLNKADDQNYWLQIFCSND